MPKPVNKNNECDLCGGFAETGDYCFAVYLHDPEADKRNEARAPDAFVHAPNQRTARRVLLEQGNTGILTSPFGMTNLWAYDKPRKRLPTHIEIVHQQ